MIFFELIPYLISLKKKPLKFFYSKVFYPVQDIKVWYRRVDKFGSYNMAPGRETLLRGGFFSQKDTFSSPFLFLTSSLFGSANNRWWLIRYERTIRSILKTIFSLNRCCCWCWWLRLWLLSRHRWSCHWSSWSILHAYISHCIEKQRHTNAGQKSTKIKRLKGFCVCSENCFATHNLDTDFFLMLYKSVQTLCSISLVVVIWGKVLILCI